MQNSQWYEIAREVYRTRKRNKLVDMSVADAREILQELGPKCDQCEAAAINGVFCHETGCPNMRKTWDVDRQEWIRYVTCRECDSEVEAGEVCRNCEENATEYAREFGELES